MLLLIILVTAYGITDEYHQLLVPGRYASGWDILADSLGGFLAALMLFWWDRRTVNISQPVLPSKEGRIPCAKAYPLSMDKDKGQTSWIT
jgi:hypothetical protein